MRTLLLTTFLSLTAGFASAAPPPPPPEYIAVAARTLTTPLTTISFGSYAALFSEDTQVFLNGVEISASKADWMALSRDHLGKADRNVIGHSEGADSIFVVDQYDERSMLPTAPNLVFDARYITRAELYKFGPDHLIHQVRIVQGGGMPWRSGG